MTKYCSKCGKLLEKGAKCNCQASKKVARKETIKEFITEFLTIYKTIFTKPIDTIKTYTNKGFDMFKNMNSSKDVLRFVTLFSVKDFSVNEFLNLVEKIAMDIVYELSSSTELITNKHKLSELSLISKGWTSSAIAKILKECFAFRESLYYNVSITPALDEFLLKFVEVKVKCKR